MVSSEEYEISDEEWKHLEVSILDNVVLIHSQLFGSGDLVQAVSLCSLLEKFLLHKAQVMQVIKNW
jgi:hypothetical protein